MAASSHLIHQKNSDDYFFEISCSVVKSCAISPLPLKSTPKSHGEVDNKDYEKFSVIWRLRKQELQTGAN